MSSKRAKVDTRLNSRQKTITFGTRESNTFGTSTHWKSLPSIDNRAKVFIWQSFLTHAEQMKLYRHLITDPSVKWQVGKYGDLELPRLLYAMKGESPLKPPPVTSEDVVSEVGASGSTQLLGEGISDAFKQKIAESIIIPDTKAEHTDSLDQSKVSIITVEPGMVAGTSPPHLQYTGSAFGGWTEPVWQLKCRLEKLMDVQITYAELNWYQSGKHYIGWHSDRELAHGNLILSISLGEVVRTLQLQRKSSTGPEPSTDDVKDSTNRGKRKITVDSGPSRVSYGLHPGCLMGMNYWSGNIDWIHRIVKEDDLVGNRICITFRMEGNSSP